MKRIPFSLFILLYVHVFSQSSNVYHEVFTKQDNLELDTIDAMLFDDDGFLWLGGTNLDVRTIVLSDHRLALYRFNGQGFHAIPLPDLATPITRVTGMYKRMDGKLYVLVESDGVKLLLFDPVSTQFTIRDYNTDKNVLQSISGVVRYADRDYILSQKGITITANILNEDLSLTPVFSFEEKVNKFTLESGTHFIPFKSQVIISDDNFPITILDWDGNIIKQYPNDAFTRERIANMEKQFIDEEIFTNDTQFFFMGYNPKLHYLNVKSNSIVTVTGSNTSLDGQQAQSFMDPLGNHLILNISEGSLRFTKIIDGKLQRVMNPIAGFDGRSIKEIISNNLEKDVWIGMDNGELHYIQFPTKAIKTFLPQKGIRAISRLDSIKYLVATENNGWFVFNTQKETIEPYEIFENGIKITPNSTRNFFIEGDTIWSHEGGNFLKVSAKTHQAEAFRHYPVICMERPTDSTIVYGTNGYNLMEFNTKSKVHTPLVKTDSLFILDIAIHDNLVVGATDRGILTYHLETKKKSFYTQILSLEDPFFLMVDYTDEHHFLLGSRSGAIIQFNPDTENFTTEYKDDLNAGIATILVREDTWWINTFNGIVNFNFKDKTKTRFSEKNGLSHSEANRYSAFDTGDKLLVGTINGLNYFDPNQMNNTSSISQLVLMKVRKFDLSLGEASNNYDRNGFAKSNRITLPAEHKELEIDFSLSHNAENREHSFRYQLGDENWTDVKQSQSLRFPNLAAGDYRLEIEALDFSGNKIGDSLLLLIQSKNFFYKTWSFYLLLTLAVISLLLWMLHQARIRRNLQEKFSQDLMTSQEVERTRIAKELHDSVGQQLTLIKKKAQNVSQSEITEMTHNALEEVREISRALYPSLLKQLGLSESIDQLVYNLDLETDLFFSSEIDDIDHAFDEASTLNFYRFIQETLSNTVKHSKAKTVSVRILNMKSKVVAEIRDNGVGFQFHEALKKNSLGLKTMSERIRILKGTLQVDSKPGKGTYLRAEIPKMK